MDEKRCSDCGFTLTDEEAYYYEHRCDRCERKHHARLVAWRKGADDAEFDRLYGDMRH